MSALIIVFSAWRMNGNLRSKCWVISNLPSVTQKYREEFIQTYDKLFALFQEEFDHYAYRSERMRNHFVEQRRRFPLLHRNGAAYLVSPGSERLVRVDVKRLPRHGVYKNPAL